MKIQKSKLVASFILLSILVILPQVYAKTSIEIKPNSSLVYTNKTISDFFDESLYMKKPGEGLEGSNVDVHMATNKDWAIVSYFSNSAYGTNGKGKNTGTTISIGGKDYLSTNGNATGVMDFGKNHTFTAGVIENYKGVLDTSETEEPYDYGKSIITNAENNRYVDLGSMEITTVFKPIAYVGWYGATAHLVHNRTDHPFSVRKGLFGGLYGTNEGTGKATGKANQEITFRPVIFNKI